MWRAYSDMRKANYIDADKYFHAKGNYDAAQRGAGGKWAASVIRWGAKNNLLKLHVPAGGLKSSLVVCLLFQWCQRVMAGILRSRCWGHRCWSGGKPLGTKRRRSQQIQASRSSRRILKRKAIDQIWSELMKTLNKLFLTECRCFCCNIHHFVAADCLCFTSLNKETTKKIVIWDK